MTRAPRLFAVLLALFPRSFREVFGDDMREVFLDQLREARAGGGMLGVLRLWVRTIPRMASAAWIERRGARRAHGRDRLPLVESVATDFRLTLRSLARSPLFTLVAVGVLSLGVGAVATIFSAMNAIVLRPLPGTVNGHQLVGIDRRTPDYSEGVSASYNLFRYLENRAQSLSGMAVWSRVVLTLAHEGRSVAVSGNIVSPSFFPVLGLEPELGRFFREEPSASLAPDTSVVISHEFWVSNFGGRADVIGRTVTMNGRPYQVIGVVGDDFRGVFTPLKVDAWVPLSAQPHIKPGRDLADAPWFWMFGRLRDGVAFDQARTELAGLTAAWAQPGGSDPYTRYNDVRLVPLTGLPDDARKALLGFGMVLLGAAAVVLLIASANAASMLAARATARGREMSLRTALGAGRGRLVRQLLTETLSVFALGAIGGLGVAWAGTTALEQLPIPGDTPLSLELSPDLRVAAFAILVALAAGLLSGLGPALRGTGHRAGALLNGASRGTSGRRSWLTKTLIVGQLAGSLALLAVAGVFARALSHGAAIDPGFDVSNVTTTLFATEAYGYDAPRGQRFYDDLRRRLEETPGVASVSFGDFTPLAATAGHSAVLVDGVRLAVQSGRAGTRYFETLGIPLLAGREFTATDTPGAPPVAIVNETFARTVWGDAPAVGRTFLQEDRRITVIGVVGNIKHSSLEATDGPFVYFALGQRWQMNQTLFVRGTEVSPHTGDAIRAAVKALDAHVPTPTVTSLAEETSLALFPQRVAAIVTGILGVGGLLLACAGLYGVMAFSVSQRQREIGVRMALGARPADVLRMVVGDGLRLTILGVVLGLAGAAAATRVVSAYLLGANALDLPAFAAVTVMLIAVSCFATYWPARRAASTDPLDTLRAD